jgi:hypothetical protein
MATTKELKTRLRTLAKNLEIELQNAAEAAALDAKTLSYRAVTSKGFGETYSENYIPAYWLDGKELNNKGKAYVKRKKKAKEGVNWKGFREAQGLQTAFVDLQYTGFMWRKFGIVRTEKKGSIYISYLGGTDGETQQKLDWNFERYGDFINESLSAKDKRFIDQNVLNKILSAIKNSGL